MVLRALILVLALAAAGGAAWLTTQNGAARPAPVAAASAPPVETVDVLVAATEIAHGAMMAPGMMRWEPRPAAGVPQGLVIRDERPTAIEEFSGAYADAAFADGEPIRASRLTADNPTTLSSRIEPGMRAVAVRVSPESVAGGFVMPGDRVDVIRTLTGSVGVASGGVSDSGSGTSSRIIVSNVRVLAIGQTDSLTTNGTVLGKTATLEASPADAGLIMTAAASGTLALALRSVADRAGPTASTGDPVATTVLVRRGTERLTVTVR